MISRTSPQSSISDSPILAGHDTLGNDKYATGLMRFIHASDTPITVGIQGGWGSGKTSLINILRHHLDGENQTISVFVNAWEHSLFQNENDKSSVAINLLAGVVDAMCQAIEAKAGSAQANDLCPAIPDEIKRQALREDSMVRKIGKFAVGVATVGAKIGARTLAGFETGDIHISKDAKIDARQEITSSRLIQQLRRDLTHSVQTIAEGTDYKRFVFFIDDLDRVHPKTAVEILDVLKNVFDIPDCVFVLAIDYEVVVKGLQEKFGEKTTENEREFRQYFDKIIQVPFSMPISAYSDKIEAFLQSQFSALRLSTANTKKIAEMARLATDGVPRGIKRIINTLSLLNQIKSSPRNGEASGHGGNFSEENPAEIEILFSVVALQINFPDIYQHLASDPRFDKWRINALWNKWNLHELFSAFSDEGDDFDPTLLSERFGLDKDWEHVIFLLCQKTSWLQRKSVDVIDFFRYLKEIIESNGPAGWKHLSNALDAVYVTDVEVSTIALEEGNILSTRNDDVTVFFKKLHTQLRRALKDSGIEIANIDQNNWAKKRGRSKSRFYTIDGFIPDAVDSLELILNEDGKLKAEATVKPPYRYTAPFRTHMGRWASGSDKRLPSEYSYDTCHFEIAGDFPADHLTDASANAAAQHLAPLIQFLQQGIQSFRR